MVDAHKTKLSLMRGLLFLFFCGLLNLLVWYVGDSLSRSLIPLYKTVFASFTENYQIQTLRLEKQAEPYFKISVITQGDRQINGIKIPNGALISSQTLQGHAFQPMIIALSLLIIWPLRRAWHRLILLSLALPGLLIILCLDIPLVLLGALEDFILAAVNPSALSQSWVVNAMHFLNGGGRLLLAFVVAVYAVVLTVFFIDFKKNNRFFSEFHRNLK